MVTATETPIGSTIERMSARFEYMAAIAGDAPDGWLRTSDIVSNPDVVSGLLDQIQELYGIEDRQIAAAFLVLGYFWYPVVAAMACYLSERRVPDLSPDAVALHLQGGAAFLSPRCWALAGDPNADHPDVAVVESLDKLRAHFMRQLEEQHATPLFPTLRSVAPYGLPAMRANYLDRVASTILSLTRQLENDDLARQEIPAFMKLAGPKVRTGVIEVQHEGRCGVFLKRGGCCLNYRIPGRKKCDTCSLIPFDERVERLRPHLIET